MTTTDPNMYAALKAQIIDNAYFLYPRKRKRSAREVQSQGCPCVGLKPVKHSSHNGHTEEVSMRSTQSAISFPSSITSLGGHVPAFEASKRDLNIAVARYYKDPDSQGSRRPEDVRFYAVVYEQDLCTGYADDEQDAQIIKSQHMLKGMVLTPWTPEDCRSKEEALSWLLARLQDEVDRRCGSLRGSMHSDRISALAVDDKTSSSQAFEAQGRTRTGTQPAASPADSVLLHSQRPHVSTNLDKSSSHPAAGAGDTSSQVSQGSTVPDPTPEELPAAKSDTHPVSSRDANWKLGRVPGSYETQETQALPEAWKYSRRSVV